MIFRGFAGVLLAVLAFACLTPSAVASPVLSDDFNDNAINPSLWKPFQQGSGPTIVESNQRLEITLPAQSAEAPAPAPDIFSAGYTSVCRLRGDFDIQVGYTLPTWPFQNGVRIGLNVGFGGVGRISGGGLDASTFGLREVYITNFTQGCCGFVNSGDLAGTLRLVRTGGTVSGYFLNSSNTWVPVGSSAATTADTGISLAAWSHDGFFTHQEVKVTFDNFVINQGQLTCLANAGPDQTVDEGAAVTLDGSNSGGTNVTFNWQQLAGLAVTLNDPTSAKPAFTAPTLPGGFGSQVLTFQLTVNSGGESSIDTVDITVSNVNTAPEAHAGPAQTVKELSPVTLDGTASFDPDGDALGYAWAQTVGTPVEIAGANLAKPTFQAPQLAGGVGGSEMLTFQLTVSDGNCATCLSSSASVTVTVEQENHAPTAHAGLDQTTNEGGNVTLNGMASSDPDGDPIGYLWAQVSGPAVALSDPATASPSFAAPVTGPGGAMMVFALVVDDGQLVSAADQVAVNVLNVNDPPRCDLAAASPAQLWPPNHKLVRVDIVGITDPDLSDKILITVTGVTQDESVNGLGDGDTSPDAVIRGDNVLLRAERSGDGNGRVYQISFTATDLQAAGGSCSGTVAVVVPQSAATGASPMDDGQQHDATLP
jgi:hypothetical protein